VAVAVVLLALVFVLGLHGGSRKGEQGGDGGDEDFLHMMWRARGGQRADESSKDADPTLFAPNYRRAGKLIGKIEPQAVLPLSK
jgi:hypothetical protein